MYLKKTTLCLMILFSLNFVTSCSPPARYADPFYNINDNDYPWLYLPLIKPIRAARQDDGSSLWRVFSIYGPWVDIPNSHESYPYSIEELEKFSVSNGVIMAYSAYVDKEADPYVLHNYYHWFVLIPDKEIGEGFHTEDEFNHYIQTLGIQEPDWHTPDEAYAQFKKTGCLEWIPNCK